MLNDTLEEMFGIASIAMFTSASNIVQRLFRRSKRRIPKASNIQSVKILQAIHRAEK